jgi:hypothetical protein
MTGRLAIWVLAGCAAWAAGCSSVMTYEDKTVPLKEYKTYQWVGQPQVQTLDFGNPDIDYLTGNVDVIRDPEVDRRFRPVIDEKMAQAGFVPDRSGSPDFYVTYFAKAENRKWVSTWEGTTPSFDFVPVVIFPRYDQNYAYLYHDRTIYLVVYDAHTKMPAWMGSDTHLDFGGKFDTPDVTASLDKLVEDFHREAGNPPPPSNVAQAAPPQPAA